SSERIDQHELNASRTSLIKKHLVCTAINRRDYRNGVNEPQIQYIMVNNRMYSCFLGIFGQKAR
ncbi:MAG: hypothetical protein AAGB12_13130, partial [Pseudomonadota bacterium]